MGPTAAAVAAFECGSEQEADLARAAARRSACSDDHESVLRILVSIDPILVSVSISAAENKNALLRHLLREGIRLVINRLRTVNRFTLAFW